MFNWLNGKKTDADGTEHELEDSSPPKIRQPKHAARDARMSIPAGEREYYDILEARKRAGSGPPSIGTSVMKGKGKGKARSPLAYVDSGLPSFNASPAFSVTTSHTSSNGYEPDIGEFWDASAGVFRRHSTAHTSLAESARDAAAKAKAKQPGNGDGTA